MSFFKHFPVIDYTQTPTSTDNKLSVNLLNSSKLLDLFPERSNRLYVDYLVRDGERPEHIAHRVYGRSDYHWIVLIANQVENPYFDWPMSYSQLRNHINTTYPGGVIFFDCTYGNLKFTKEGTSTPLTVAQSHFVVGNTIEQGSRTATITAWDPTFRRLIIEDASPDYTFVNDEPIISTNSDGVSFEVTPKRIVLENKEAVHHFEDDFSNHLDPYGKINLAEYADGKIFSRGSIFRDNTGGFITLGDENDYPLHRYINGSFENYAVTNQQYELNHNDRKRKIKLLKVEYVSKIVSDLEKIFN